MTSGPEGTTAPPPKPLTAAEVAAIRREFDEGGGDDLDIYALLDSHESLRSQLASRTPGVSEEEAEKLIDTFEIFCADPDIHHGTQWGYARAALLAALVRNKV